MPIATIVSAIFGSHEASNAAQQNNALQSQIYSSDKALEQPYVTAGANAADALQGFLGIGGDPAAASKSLNDYLDSTGYQFNRQQGLDGVTQSKAASGLLGSGSTLTALDSYATGLADQYGQQYEQNLQGLAGTGAGAANALAGQGQSYAGAVGANTNAAALAAANAALTSANAFNGGLTSALSAYGLTRGASSFGGAGGAGGANAFAAIGG
ncbi:MAG TPA: hypothetical protein VG248_02730 [Caulobacteraceae bacterium]|jgi:hypothetical protein|nr:hypothetical protein [Caulobacteraceae bacterium]